ncbi:hypothetical protein FV241_29715 [Methylobacterium sp. WL2]|nr:hypothetical protein FVA80_00075 [Methylobacterium sp. WL1]TXN52329.1 hypothetical protein FV241_29715 [Methylobacterium sp. WL2]
MSAGLAPTLIPNPVAMWHGAIVNISERARGVHDTIRRCGRRTRDDRWVRTGSPHLVCEASAARSTEIRRSVLRLVEVVNSDHAGDVQ